VAVNVVDPTNAWRIAMVRGRIVEVTTEGAVEQIDQLAKSTSAGTPTRFIGRTAYAPPSRSHRRRSTR